MKRPVKVGILTFFAIFLWLLPGCQRPGGTAASSAPVQTTVHVHAYGAWQTITEASCTKSGQQVRVCACGQVDSQSTQPLGHLPETAAGYAATCTAAGLTDGEKCGRCGEVLRAGQAIPATGHTVQTDAAVAPTCIAAGLSQGSRCAVCGLVLQKPQSVQALGHDFAAYRYNGDATCLADGTESAACTRCSATDTRTAAQTATGHAAIAGTATAPTCTTTGLTADVRCGTCGAMLAQQELIPALGHDDEMGYCTRCGVEKIVTSGGLAYVRNEDGAGYTLVGMGICTDTKVVIPEIFNGLPVTAIGEKAFANCADITAVSMRSGVVSIGASAFENCGALQTIQLPDGVQTIGTAAFRGCGRLRTIKLPASVQSIGAGAFWFCSDLKSVYITDLAQWCAISFDGVGANPLSVANSLYLDGKPVTHLQIPAQVTSIADFAFVQCNTLRQVSMGSQVTAIGSHAFYYCAGLETLILGDNVQTIGASAFEGCAALKTLTVPAAVTAIGESAFVQCSALEAISVAAGNEVYHSSENCLIETGRKTLLLGCQNSRIPVDGSVSVVGGGAFQGCTALEQIALPACLQAIGRYAFENCPALRLILFEGTQSRWEAVEKAADWIWKNELLGITFRNDPTPLTLSREDITLSPANGLSFDLYQLLVGQEEFDRSDLICTSADSTVVQVKGTVVTALATAPEGVYVTIRHGDRQVQCLVRTEVRTGVQINKTDVTLTLGKEGYETFVLKLTDRTGQSLNDVQWSFSNDFSKCCTCTLNRDSGALTITAQAVTTTLQNGAYVLVWTTYQGVRYQCIIRIVSI